MPKKHKEHRPESETDSMKTDSEMDSLGDVDDEAA